MKIGNRKLSSNILDNFQNAKGAEKYLHEQYFKV